MSSAISPRPRMTAGELKAARQRLGMSARQLARALKLGPHGERSIRRYEDGEREVPGPVEVAIRMMVDSVTHPVEGGQTMLSASVHQTRDERTRRLREIGQRIRDVRQARQLTMEAFADELGLTQSALHRFETGITEPSVQLLDKLHQKYGVSADSILFGE